MRHHENIHNSDEQKCECSSYKYEKNPTGIGLNSGAIVTEE